MSQARDQGYILLDTFFCLLRPASPQHRNTVLLLHLLVLISLYLQACVYRDTEYLRVLCFLYLPPWRGLCRYWPVSWNLSSCSLLSSLMAAMTGLKAPLRRRPSTVCSGSALRRTPYLALSADSVSTRTFSSCRDTHTTTGKGEMAKVKGWCGVVSVDEVIGRRWESEQSQPWSRPQQQSPSSPSASRQFLDVFRQFSPQISPLLISPFYFPSQLPEELNPFPLCAVLEPTASMAEETGKISISISIGRAQERKFCCNCPFRTHQARKP